MGIDLQKASFGKRIIAFIFDALLVCVLAVGCMTLLSSVIDYDSYHAKYEKAYNEYSAKYEVDLNAEQYNALTEEEKADYQNKMGKASEAFSKDADAMHAYNMTVSLMFLNLTFSALISIIALEFVVPIFFKNGQTIGKKIFGIGLMHVDGIKISNVQLFARSILGKFAIELMIPLYIIIMLSFGSIGIVGVTIMLILFIVELICLASSHTNPLIHDKLAQTVAIDLNSQKIFNSREELLEHTKAIHADRAARAIY